jgi:hypothetical protein
MLNQAFIKKSLLRARESKKWSLPIPAMMLFHMRVRILPGFKFSEAGKWLHKAIIDAGDNLPAFVVAIPTLSYWRNWLSGWMIWGNAKQKQWIEF